MPRTKRGRVVWIRMCGNGLWFNKQVQAWKAEAALALLLSMPDRIEILPTKRKRGRG